MTNKAAIDERIWSLENRASTFDDCVHKAAHWGRVEELRELLAKDVKVNVLDKENKTPLDLAIHGQKLLQKLNLNNEDILMQKSSDFKLVLELLFKANAKYGYDVLEESTKTKLQVERRARNEKYMIAIVTLFVAIVALFLPFLAR
eukprot:GEMP01113469.1.p1 GENE.GEMP01113469.1~~GEMP01113469.1.p1  ORF type:complete len:146 (+),score=32.69 GEMP01113469.1:173-610(+)